MAANLTKNAETLGCLLMAASTEDSLPWVDAALSILDEVFTMQA